MVHTITGDPVVYTQTLVGVNMIKRFKTPDWLEVD